MTQVAIARLSELWPHAQVEVVTSSPHLLSRYSPSAVPLGAEERGAWLSGRSLTGGLGRELPASISVSMQNLERRLWFRHPAVAELGLHLKAKLRHRAFVSPSSFRERVTGASLLVASGAGVLNDAFEDQASPLLDELDFALQAGIPVVAFGQGVGPITDPKLLSRAQEVLPRLSLIGLREGRTGLPLLESLGVARDRIFVTGDDAIELALDRRPSSLGDAIGINVRLANYAGTDEQLIGRLREPLHCAAQKLKSSLLSVPISLHHTDSDIVSNGSVLDDKSPGSQTGIESPEDVIRLVGKCRVVVTGSYHGGVFALAQGIPIVGLMQSPYYEQKFRGLQQQFPGGCRTLDFRQPVTSVEIQDAICGAWESAEQVREALIEAATHQVELSRAAYRLVREMYPLGSRACFKDGLRASVLVPQE